MRWVKALCVGLVCTMLLSLCGFSADCEDLRTRVLRLHILAASDSAEDQAMKLKVRDAVLQATNGLLDGVVSTDYARQKVKEALPLIEATAAKTLRQGGSDDSVAVELCEMYFTTRQYETVTMPAGVYEAVRITIGKGKGHNWWCVVFPPMCLSGATGLPLDEVLTDTQIDIVSQQSQYEVRFKIVEWFEGLREEMRQRW